MRIRLELTGSKVAVSFLLQWYLCWAANRCVLNPVGLQRSPETIGQETLAATQGISGNSELRVPALCGNFS